MTKIVKERIIASVDVGTTKICVSVAHYNGAGQLELLGMGKVASLGLQRGVVVDVAKTIQSVKGAIKEAEAASGIAIDGAYIGISGGHIRSFNSQAAVPLTKGKVTAQDVAHVLGAAQAMHMPEGYQILHVVPQYFVIDGKEKLYNPVGMHGLKLEASVHIILGAVASVQNLISCCEQAGLRIHDIVLEPLASAEAVLSEDERQLGVAMLDIGGGTSDFAVYKHGSIVHTAVVPIAGNHFTNDIAIGFRTTIKDAERVKTIHGTVNPANINENIEVELAQGGHMVTMCMQALSVILQARAYELLDIVRNEIREKELKKYCTSGLVITGGGSLLNGFDVTAKRMLDMPVRIASVHSSFALPPSFQAPMYATSFGLLLHAIKTKQSPFNRDADGPFVKRVLKRMKSWANDFF